MKLPRRSNFCIWPRALPRCRQCLASRGRRPIRREPVRLIVGFPAGGGADIVARLMESMAVGAARSARHHREPAGRWRPISRTEAVRQRRRLTATRCCGTAYPRTRSTPALYDNLHSISCATSHPVAGVVSYPMIMVANPSVPAKTVPEFIAYAKANPGKVNYGVVRHRLGVASGRRTVQVDGRHRHGARPLSRRRTMTDGPDRRSGSGRV